jgi:phage shock protein A
LLRLLEAKSKKDTLKARAQSAKTQKKVNEIAGAIDVDSSLAAFEKMEQKVMALESEADAVAQLGSGDASLENKFKELEGGSVDDELAAMKAGMLKEAAPPKKLPEGRPIKDAIDLEVDAELEALRKKANEK